MPVVIPELPDIYAPPVVEIDGRRYVGRILSLEETAPFVGWMAKAANNELSTPELAALVRVYLRTVFPWRVGYLFGGDPVTRLCRLPWNELSRVFADFFARQAATMTPPGTTGSSSASRGPSPTGATAPSP